MLVAMEQYRRLSKEELVLRLWFAQLDHLVAARKTNDAVPRLFDPEPLLHAPKHSRSRRKKKAK